ncbi:hypothetical protein ABZ636_25205 [Streptomyces sp. NPDC007251]|uniref:hypothetical protein n=1 Tax=unclassified Streptomyces TaxID=2593676 RepID=UPI0033DAD729
MGVPALTAQPSPRPRVCCGDESPYDNGDAEGASGGNSAVRCLRGRPTGLVTDAALVFGGKAVGAP